MLLLMIVAKVGYPSSNKLRLLLFVAFLAASVAWIRRGADYYEDEEHSDGDKVDQGNK